MEGYDESHLLYFFSVDVINSTAFKNDKQKREVNNSKYCVSSSWAIAFKNFYDEIRKILNDKYNEIIKRENIEKENFYFPFQWRIIGDEIVFFSVVKSFVHILYHLEASKNTIVDFNKDKKKIPFSVKGTAWIAGFPVNNTIIKSSSEKGLNFNSNGKISDFENVNFLGPSIDIGFRISKYSSSRKFILSIDLAMIVTYLINNKQSISKFKFYFDNNQMLKGVGVDGQYPIIWILSEDDIKEKDSFYLEKSSPCCTKLLYDHLKSTLENLNLLPPFIIGCEHSEFTIPDEYDSLYKGVIEEFEYAFNVVQDIESKNEKQSESKNEEQSESKNGEQEIKLTVEDNIEKWVKKDFE
ncbi:conserved hypothetical protein [Arcobacter nitrofigilis DSM 7299]|uniref:Uncharacterized protein n=1 Tax=Arcobacter nitrofigilis (strain ATCC 33309 / DSM 7299 / CCUG 15893 / LMG 7604 / NCTC 12251 / CI) TaxID=572480 RepID=D5V4C5_ARCNC|nr:hypothetical protein [Arcobacter nitrofigilis]ADG91858.1 conserved hypothetical protein [Arcobacter nitrofigilis DSM 7299]